jgi:hypothetical protein
MKKEPMQQMGSDKIIPRHVCDEPFTIRFLDRSEWKERFQNRNIYILSDNQAAIKALGKHHITSKLVWDCHQSFI